MRERETEETRGEHTHTHNNKRTNIYIYICRWVKTKERNIYIYICMEITGVIIPMTIGIILLHHRIDIEPLNNQIELSNYSLNTPIETLVEQLFIENIKINYYFNELYDECKPILCSYSYNSKGTITFIFLTVLSLIGGLSVVLKVLSTYLVKLIEIIKRKFRKKTNAINQSN